MSLLIPVFRKRLVFLAFLTLLPLLITAEGETGSGRMSGGQCPNQFDNSTERTMVFSPFKPYWKFEVPNKPNNDPQNCWIVADCTFEAAGESRKQQFGATALVMGMVPGAVKDIAWPERRVVYVTKRLNWAIEILVLALGLVPIATERQEDTRFRGSDGNTLAKIGWEMEKLRVKFCVAISAVGVVVCYASLAIMEVYSKRSALGCVVPIFVVAWHIIALLPAAVHSGFASLRRQRFQRKDISRSSPFDLRRMNRNKRTIDNCATTPPSERHKPSERTFGQHIDGNDENENLIPGATRDDRVSSAVQGANEDWPVQMAWVIYYIAGTLVFTSIMAVTVPELVVWVALGLATAGCSKILAFFLCLVYEDTGAHLSGRVELLPWSEENANSRMVSTAEDE